MAVPPEMIFDGVPLITGGIASLLPPPKPAMYPLLGIQGVGIPGPSGMAGVTGTAAGEAGGLTPVVELGGDAVWDWVLLERSDIFARVRGPRNPVEGIPNAA